MAYAVNVTDVEPADTAVVRTEVPMAEIGTVMGAAFKDVWDRLREWGVTPTGTAFGRFKMLGDRVAVEAGFAVSAPVAGDERVRPGRLPGGPAAVTVHEGPYEEIGAAYEAVSKWVAAHKRIISGDPWEVYLTPPDADPPRTRVVFPIAPA
ncbi:MAG: GyrI-like domain-containing protein [Bauldia sp.]|nr:GyrI-like domain-containing protein [Bauldia sp.]